MLEEAPPPLPNWTIDYHAGILAKLLRLSWYWACPPTKTAPRKPFVTPELYEALGDHATKRKAFFVLAPDLPQLEALRQETKASAAAAQQALQKAHRDWADTQSKELQEKAENGDTSVIWTLSKALRRAKASPKMPLQVFRDLQGRLVSTPEARAGAWRDVFANEFSHQVRAYTRPELQILLN